MLKLQNCSFEISKKTDMKFPGVEKVTKNGFYSL